jgi:predicted ribonuclease YlaK
MSEGARSLESQPTRLIGRTRELDALRKLLQREDVCLVTITGTAGIGKTRLPPPPRPVWSV